MTEELKELLGEDGSRVYKEVEKALQGGNARTKSAASVGALRPRRSRRDMGRARIACDGEAVHGTGLHEERDDRCRRHSAGRRTQCFALRR